MPVPLSAMQAAANSEQQVSSCIKEGDMVNVHVTAPGAILALALIHQRSNNAFIANKLVMPDTFSNLDCVNPQVLLLKIIAKNLILWDEVVPTEQWVQSQVPQLISFCHSATIEQVHERYPSQKSQRIDFAAIALCHMYSLTAAHLSLAFKYAGTRNKDVTRLLQAHLTYLKK